MKRMLLLVLLSYCLGSCKDLFQYSPNEVRLEAEDKDLNAKNIAKIKALTPKDTFRFIVIGDSQRFYDDLDNFVDHVNKVENVAFVLLNGDITDFGLNREYKWISRGLKRLNFPYIGVIGNHDMLANGRQVYKEMFGPEDFSFTYGASKFVCLNTNTMETGHDGSLPDMRWLQSQLAMNESSRNTFVFSHVSPLDGEFDKNKKDEFTTMLQRNGVRLSIHGHQHSWSISQPEGHSLKYLVVASVQKRSYALITVSGQTYTIEQKFF
jgi:predicted phosphodiesterase